MVGAQLTVNEIRGSAGRPTSRSGAERSLQIKKTATRNESATSCLHERKSGKTQE